MLDSDTLKKTLMEYGLLNENIKVYEQESTVGLLIKCEREETIDGKVWRLFVFEDEKNLKEFLTMYIQMIKYNDAIHLYSNNLESIISKNYSFIKDGSEYTYNDAVEDLNNEKNQIKKQKKEYIVSAKKKYLFLENSIEYYKFINSIDLQYLENIYKQLEENNFDNINDVESIIEQYSFKPRNECKISINDSDVVLSEKIPNTAKRPQLSFSKQEETNRLNLELRKNTYMLDPFNSKSFEQLVRNEEKYKKVKMYLEKIEFLLNINKQSRIKRILNKSKNKKVLKEIESKYSFLSNQEQEDKTKTLNSLYSYFLVKQNEIKEMTYNRFTFEDVIFFRTCMNVSYEEGKKKIDDYFDRIMNSYNGIKEEANTNRMKQEKKRNDKNANCKRIYSNLVQQYEKNLTEQEKMALLAYNSSLFFIINIISSIPNYEKLSDEQLSKEISNRFKEVFGKDVSKFYFAGKLNREYKGDQSKIGTYINNILSGNVFSNIVGIIKVLDGIKNKILLPEDLTVYRCISTPNPNSNPAMGQFLSTSLSCEAAKRYYQISNDKKQPVMYKIKLKKGTPITAVFPEKVLNLETGKLIVDDLESNQPVMEIMLNMNDYEIESESIQKSFVRNLHYDSNKTPDLEKDSYDYTIYEITINPKEELIESLDINNRE